MGGGGGGIVSLHSGLCARVLTVLSVLALYKKRFSGASALKVFNKVEGRYL